MNTEQILKELTEAIDNAVKQRSLDEKYCAGWWYIPGGQSYYRTKELATAALLRKVVTGKEKADD